MGPASSLVGHTLYPGIQFFLAQANSRVHALATNIPSLKENAKHSMINSQLWKVIQNIQAVSLRVVFVSILLTNDSNK